MAVESQVIGKSRESTVGSRLLFVILGFSTLAALTIAIGTFYAMGKQWVEPIEGVALLGIVAGSNLLIWLLGRSILYVATPAVRRTRELRFSIWFAVTPLLVIASLIGLGFISLHFRSAKATAALASAPADQPKSLPSLPEPVVEAYKMLSATNNGPQERKLADAVLPLFREGMDIRERCETKRAELEKAGLLLPATLQTLETLRNRRQMAEDLLASYYELQKFIARYGDDAASRMKSNGIAAGIGHEVLAVNRAKTPLALSQAESLVSEARSFVETLSFLERSYGSWIVAGGKFHFEKPQELAEFEKLSGRLAAASAQERD